MGSSISANITRIITSTQTSLKTTTMKKKKKKKQMEITTPLDTNMMLSRYTDLADFTFFNRFHDDLDDQDFL
ncbi:hypothetical protein Tco_0901290 [Tanacetum coccineum]